MSNHKRHRTNCTTRRKFLTGTLSVAGASLFGTLGAGPFAAPSAPGIRLGLATYQWGMNWDLPTLLANLQRAKVLGVELRTQTNYKHGVELELGPAQRAEVKRRFADSPIKVVAIACSERMDWPDPARLKAGIPDAKRYLQLSHDIGARSVRVFPNQFHPEVPQEKTIEQIARALNDLGGFAADLGQRVALEAHGPAGELPTVKAVMDQVTALAVGVRLNCDNRDTSGGGLEANFNLVKNRLAETVHLHNLKDTTFPYPQLLNLLAKAGWAGWMLMENTEKEPDLVAAMIEQRKLWEGFMKEATKRL
jgi:sugar phosphate isomerase/epimerase